MNADPEVMQHFPSVLSVNESKDLLIRLKRHFQEKGHTYFATEVLNNGDFIGFIGLAYQDYPSEFTPAVDIGWRLKTAFWGQGYATEGAKRCLEFGFENLGLERIISTCTLANTKSENVMKKIGMEKLGLFKHPRLKDYPDYETCLCYEITNN